MRHLIEAPQLVAPVPWPGPGSVQKSLWDASTQTTSQNLARPTTATHRLKQNHRLRRWLRQFRLRDSARGCDGQTQDKRLDV